MGIGDTDIDESWGHCHLSEFGTLSLMRVGDNVIDKELGTLSLMRVGDIVFDESWGHCHK